MRPINTSLRNYPPLPQKPKLNKGELAPRTQIDTDSYVFPKKDTDIQESGTFYYTPNSLRSLADIRRNERVHELGTRQEQPWKTKTGEIIAPLGTEPEELIERLTESLLGGKEVSNGAICITPHRENGTNEASFKPWLIKVVRREIEAQSKALETRLRILAKQNKNQPPYKQLTLNDWPRIQAKQRHVFSWNNPRTRELSKKGIEVTFTKDELPTVTRKNDNGDRVTTTRYWLEAKALVEKVKAELERSKTCPPISIVCLEV
ncbi:MAG: hypothetical protein VKK59_04985 [Vampirovibrionales bacterium]|nr:hypothetical protein [Vampirovibrionales bacterium]